MLTLDRLRVICHSVPLYRCCKYRIYQGRETFEKMVGYVGPADAQERARYFHCEFGVADDHYDL